MGAGARIEQAVADDGEVRHLSGFVRGAPNVNPSRANPLYGIDEVGPGTAHEVQDAGITPCGKTMDDVDGIGRRGRAPRGVRLMDHVPRPPARSSPAPLPASTTIAQRWRGTYAID